jgi:NAD(P)-dependent dehydrogenase (short-subunit alcohol dehydrogenase family)
MTSNKTLVAAVTGAGRGLGRELALGLAAKNYRVFGTATSQAEIDALRQASDGAVLLSLCDITDESAVKRWTQSVVSETGGELDLLINNAGILSPGPVEFVPLDEVRREFEVNVIGSLSVINSFLPALRNARGRIVQISTITARLPLPFNGPSGASKAAIEAFATVYRAELKPFGVDVVIVAPGNLRTTGSMTTAAALAKFSKEMTPEQRELYGEKFDKFAAGFNAMQSNGLDSVNAANQIIAISEQTPAPAYATVGPDAEQFIQVVREKSDAELDTFRLELLGLN